MSNVVKNFLSKIGQAFEQVAETTEVETKDVKLESAMMADGTQVEADEFEVGNTLFVVTEGELIPVPAGTYDLDNGMTVTCNDMGIIEAVMPTEAAGEEQPAAAPAAAPEVEAGKMKAGEERMAKKVVESTVKETMYSAEQVEQLVADAVAKMQKENQHKVELSKDEIAHLKDKIEALETKLSEQPVAAPMPRVKKVVNKPIVYGSPDPKRQKTSDRILTKMANTK